MTQYQIAIVALLIAQAFTLWLLWRTQQAGEWFRKAWARDSAELIHWKRYATLRDAKTGRYVKKGKR